MTMDRTSRKRSRGVHCMRIEKVVGSGTFGVVYKAVDKRDQAQVALKKIRMERETQGFPVTAIREIKILNLMRNHENIVCLREIVTYDDTDKDSEPTLADKKFDTGDVFMVFEFVDYDLSGLLKSLHMQLTEQHARVYLHQLLKGVKYLHDNGVLHRDLKSANLLITKNNVLKIADWGLARSLPEDKNPNAKLTNPVVTLWYRSPEVIAGSKRYDRGVDIWSVGCIFGEIRTRVALFRGESEAAQLDLIFQLTGYPQGETLKQYEQIEQWQSFSALNRSHQDTFAAKFLGQGKGKLDSVGLSMLKSLLDINPTTRLTADQALEHDYFKHGPVEASSLPLITIAPVTEWMEQERSRAEHEAQKQLRHQREQQAHHAREGAHQHGIAGVAGAFPPMSMPGGGIPPPVAVKATSAAYVHMKRQAEAGVVNKYKIVKKDKSAEGGGTKPV